ncbi:MAG: tetratricopeptide repeat protein, partial [Trichodesmium sp.]
MLAENYFNTANQLQDSGQFYTAMVAYQKALSIKPDYVEAYKKLAELYLVQGNFDAAISACRESLKIQPSFADIYLTLGNIFQSQKLFEQAIDVYDEGLKVQPSFAEIYANLGSVYYQQGQFDLAILNYQNALEINCQLASVQLMLGNVFVQKKEFDRAVFCYQSLLELEPENPKVYLRLARVFTLQGNLELAINYLQKSLSIQPEYRESFTELYRLLKSESTEEEVERAFSEWQKFALGNNHGIKEYIDLVIQQKSVSFLEKDRLIGEQNRETINLDSEHGIQPETLNLIPEEKVETFPKTSDNLSDSEQREENLGKNEKVPHFVEEQKDSEFSQQLSNFPSADTQNLSTTFNLIPEEKVENFPNSSEHLSDSEQRQENLGKNEKVPHFAEEQKDSPICQQLSNFPSAETQNLSTTFNFIPEEKVENFPNSSEHLPDSEQRQENLGKNETVPHFAEEQKDLEFCQQLSNFPSADTQNLPTTFNLIPEKKVENFDDTSAHLLYQNEVGKNQENSSKPKTFASPELKSDFPKKLLKYPAAETYINQANLALKERNLPLAISSCKQALKIQPDYAPSYVTLGNAFYQQNNLKAALRAYSQALEIEPEVAEVQGNIGSVYLQLGQHKQALFHYQKAIELKPSLAGIYWNIGKLFQYLGKVDEALDAWEKALEIQPDIVEADFHFKLGNTLVKLSRINDAVKSYERAINLKPDYTEAYSNLANILGKQGDKAAAAKYYQKALDVNPELKHLHEKLANNLLLKGDYDQAIFHYQEAIKYNPKSYDAYANLGTALSNKGLLELALEKYYKALELKPNWAEVYSRIGHIIKQEKMEEAIALFEKAIEVKPKFVEAHQQLCDLLSHTTKLAAARKAADNFCNSCGEIAPILSGTAFLFSYFQSGVSEVANSKLSEVEKICYQSCETFSEIEIKLLYEIFLFAVPHLRDDLEGNAKFYKLIAKQYYQNRPKIYQTPKTYTSSSQPLKIGFLSKHFRRHSVGWCSEALIRELSQITPNVHLYITGPLKRDDITQRFEQMSVKTYSPKKYPNGFPSYEEITTQILEDNLDVVVDLDSMTLPVNVHIIHEKPAPVCVSWLGFDAPYISENNYFLCDWYTHPQGREEYYLEKLVRLPETSIAVDGFDSRSVDRNSTRNSLGIDSDKMVYLCIAPGRKTNPEMVRAQLKILQHTPESILIRKGQGDVDIIYQTYLQESENLGVDFNRIIFLG